VVVGGLRLGIVALEQAAGADRRVQGVVSLYKKETHPGVGGSSGLWLRHVCVPIPRSSEDREFLYA